MVSLLTEKKDRALIQQWGIWMTKRDPERGLKVKYITNLIFLTAPLKLPSAFDGPGDWQTT